MDEYANSLKRRLTSLIKEMSARPSPYVKKPGKNFTRKKKLPFETVMQLSEKSNERLRCRNNCYSR